MQSCKSNLDTMGWNKTSSPLDAFHWPISRISHRHVTGHLCSHTAREKNRGQTSVVHLNTLAYKRGGSAEGREQITGW